MLVLKSILSLFLIRYVFAVPSIIVPRQDPGADKSPIRLPSSLDEKITGTGTNIKQELGHPISEQNEFSSSESKKRLTQSLSSSRMMARSKLPIRYHVPGTQIELAIHLGEPIDELALARGLHLVRSIMENLIMKFGDHQLAEKNDPYRLKTNKGLIVEMSSNLPQDSHLTFKIIAIVAQGLMEVLVGQSRYRAAIFAIYETGSGRVGSGSVTRPR